MPVRRSIILVLMTLFLIIAPLFRLDALNGVSVIHRDTVLTIYFNLGMFYSLAVQKLKNLDEPSNAGFKQIISQAYPAMLDNLQSKLGPDQIQRLPQTLAEAVKFVMDWDASGPLKPTGGVWLSIGSGFMPNLFVEAVVKPDEIVSRLPALPNDIKRANASDGSILLTIPAPPPQKGSINISFRKDGIFVETILGEKTAQSAQGWEYVTRNALATDVMLILDSDPRGLTSELGRQEAAPAGKDSSKAIPLLDWKRLRGIVTFNKILIMAVIDDASKRAEAKAALENFIQKGQGLFSQGQLTLPEAQIELFRKLFERLTIIDKAPWIGLTVPTEGSDSVFLTGVGTVGFLAAIVVPNFIKARDTARDKACFASRKVLQGAIELHDLDNSEMLQALDMEMFQKKGYIRQPVVCPNGGEFSMSRDGQSLAHVSCSIHGNAE
ncbi:MAG TPA: hypothetical protein PKM25_10190 [Candidatus Ozemobacteraceae bacterium]|nr:hypothetical protein [Candidatus Ozemobacteraceae bacterium]